MSSRTCLSLFVFGLLSLIISACTLPFPRSLNPDTDTARITTILRAVRADSQPLSAEAISAGQAILQARASSFDRSASVEQAGNVCYVLRYSEDADAGVLLATVLAQDFVEFVDVGDGTTVSQGQIILSTAQIERGLDFGGDADAAGQPFASIITGNDVLLAESTAAPFGDENYMVSIRLSPEAGAVFAEYTAAHIGLPLALVLNGEILSIPIIQSALSDELVISGNFSESETLSLAAQLNSGALPFALEVVVTSALPDEPLPPDCF